MDRFSEKEFNEDKYILKLFTTASFNNKVKELMDKVVKNDYSLVGSFDIEKFESSNKDGEVMVPEQIRHNYVIVDE